jgi:hypothetical protein
MEPAPRAESVFLFTKPAAGEVFGYTYDGWHSDGTFHYTGDGQVGDQLPTEGGNRAVLAAASLGRTIRLFRSEGVETTYLGAFQLAEPAFYRAESQDRNSEMRQVLVFRLVPMGSVVKDLTDAAVVDLTSPQELQIEASNVEAYAVARPDEPAVAVRREAELVARYERWLADRGETSVRHRIPIPGGGYVVTDLYAKHSQELIEAKASAGRSYIRAGLGQILDYGRFIQHRSKAILVPSEPSADLVELLRAHDVDVIWPSNDGFTRA